MSNNPMDTIDAQMDERNGPDAPVETSTSRKLNASGDEDAAAAVDEVKDDKDEKKAAIAEEETPATAAAAVDNEESTALTKDPEIEAKAEPKAASAAKLDENQDDAIQPQDPSSTTDDAPLPSPARKKQKMYTPLLHSNTTKGKEKGPEKDSPKLNFAQRLMELLEKDDVKPILHWNDDGRSICIEDPTRFALEIMPKYFSDTKYKSFMVRMKRWGFKTVTQKHKPKTDTSKIMECDMFRRDQPELCLLMGDERRVDRLNVAKAIIKGNGVIVGTGVSGNDLAGSPVPATTTATTAPTEMTVNPSSSPTRSSTAGVVPTAPISHMDVARLSLLGLDQSPQELAMLHQRHYQLQRLREMAVDMETFDLISASNAASGHQRYPTGSPTSMNLSGYRDGLQHFIGSGNHHDPISAEMDIANASLFSIERGIQDCRSNIAFNQHKLAQLEYIKMMRLRSSAGGGIGGAGLISSGGVGSGGAAAAGLDSVLTQQQQRGRH